MTRESFSETGRVCDRIVSDRPVSRIFIVLEAIQRMREPVTLTAVARGTGLPKSTVHRLLAELVSHDLVCRRGDHYRLGARMWRLLEPCHDHFVDLRSAIKPIMVQLHYRTRCLIGLGILGNTTVKFVDTIFDDEYSRVVNRIVGSSLLHESAAGKVLLAFRGELVADIALGDHRGSVESVVADLSPELQGELSQIRLRKMATSKAASNLGITAAAVPVLDANRRPVAALSIGAYRDRFDAPAIHHVLYRAANHAQLILQRHSYRPESRHNE